MTTTKVNLHVISPGKDGEVSFQVDVPEEIKTQLLCACSYMRNSKFSKEEISDMIMDIAWRFIDEKMWFILDPFVRFRSAGFTVDLLREECFLDVLEGTSFARKAKKIQEEAHVYMANPYHSPFSFVRLHSKSIHELSKVRFHRLGPLNKDKHD